MPKHYEMPVRLNEPPRSGGEAKLVEFWGVSPKAVPRANDSAAAERSGAVAARVARALR